MTLGRVRHSAILRLCCRSAILALLLSPSSCAHVPPEAVDLSQRMGQDLAAVHLANRELARSYYGTLRAQVDVLVDTKYRPYVLESAIENTGLLQQLDAARRPGAELDALDVLDIFVEESFARIDSFRAELHAPLDAQEREVLSRIDEAHDALLRGNTAITAHLISVRKVEKEQDTLMGKAGLPADFRQQLANVAGGASSSVGDLLKRAKSGSATMDSLPAQLRRALRQ